MIEGIDVSHHQGDIDWNKVAAAGRRFVYCKATEGTDRQDLTFEWNLGAARARGLYVGAYHFARPLTDPELQARLFCARLTTVLAANPLTFAPSRPGGVLPPVLDLEEAPAPGVPDQWLTLPVDQRIAWVCKFVNAVEQAIGRTCVIYTRRGWWRDVMGDSGALAACPLWAVQYLRAGQERGAAPAMPAAWGTRWSLWQYSGAGKCDGVTGDVDLDCFNGDEAALAQLASGTVA
jgi:GH25 family lysozyme M1 (1,4-beta-N-acetylmuramidase)